MSPSRPSRNHKQTFYAVRRGWQGSQVYESLAKAHRAVTGLPKASTRSFKQRRQADAWLLKDPEIGLSHSHVSSGRYVPSPSELVQAYRYFEEKGFLRDGVTLEQALASITEPQTLPQSCLDIDTEDLSKQNPLPTPDPTPTPRTVPSPSCLHAISPVSSPLRPTTPSSPLAQPTARLGPEPPPEPTITLCSKQLEVLNEVKTGNNVFFTGSAGTGKTVLLAEIIKWCKENRIRLAVTAATGIAAINLGGSTLHSFAGVGLGKEDKEVLVDNILDKKKHLRRKREQDRVRQGLPPNSPSDEDYWSDRASWPRLVKKWQQTDALIIDEISMVDGQFFDKLEYIARCVRKRHEPFGGIQLIICGDFCQLPPVADEVDDEPVPAVFAFKAKSWDRCIKPPMVLTEVFRQKDQEFVDLLNALRFGYVTPGIIATLRRLQRRVIYTDGIEPTELYPTRNEVDVSNCFKLQRIKKEAHTFQAKDKAGWDYEKNQPVPQKRVDRLLSRLVAPESLTLKEGAQVMLIKNIVQGLLVNGTIGKVIAFLTTREAADRGHKIAYPVSENKEEEDLTQSVNRRKRPRNSFDTPSKSHARLAEDSHKYPLVYFPSIGAHLLCVPNDFDVKNAKGKMEASREQVPLILAWALSIHKSQGQTLQRVRVDLERVFATGQAYVALSRAVSLDTLEVTNFDPTRVKTDPHVMDWALRYMPQSIPEEIRNKMTSRER